MKATLPLLILLHCCGLLLSAQSSTISGIVTDASESPLAGATVSVKNTSVGTVADADGSYALTVPVRYRVLVFKYVGYETAEVIIKGRDQIDVTLHESTSQLDEVVVMGFSRQSKQHVTSAISSVDSKVFSLNTAPNFQRSLQGRMPGVVITNASGALSSEAIIRIRGTGSINAGNQPLFVIDGIISNANPGQGFGFSTNPLIGLNPSDIESVRVLKDAASASVYGARGGNGVILITTRTGRFNMQPKVSLGYYAGFSEITNKYDILSGPEYAGMWNYAARYDTSAHNPVYPDPGSEPTVDWQDMLLQKGFLQEVNASVTGGTASNNYFIGASVRDEDFYMRRVGIQRYSIRANLEHKIGDHVTAGIKINPSRVIDNRTHSQWLNGAWAFASWYMPNVVAFDEGGNCIRERLSTSIGQQYWFDGNPCTMLEDVDMEAVRNNMLLNTSLNWSVNPSFSLSTEWNAEYSREQQHLRALPSTWIGSPQGWAWTNQLEDFSYNWTNLANWNSAFGEGHELRTTAGIQLSKATFNQLSVDGGGFSDDRQRLVGSASVIEFVDTDQTASAFLGYLTRLDYNFQNRYLVTLSARYDGSSRFGTGNRYGFFPAASAGWVISGEKGFDLSFVSFLKLRSSIGLAGNAGIDDFSARGLVSFDSEYSGQPGFVINSLQNDGLKWEKNRQWDVALEFSLFDNRLSGTVEYFNKLTRDLLMDKPVPATSGFDRIAFNVGEIRNTGLEFDLNLSVLKGALNWDINMNGAVLKNEVLRLADLNGDGMDEDIIYSGRLMFRPGESASSFYLVEYAGVDPDNGDALYYDLEGNTLGIPKVSLGQSVEIANPALAEPLIGKVLFVSSEADIQKNTLQVKVEIPSPSPVFKPEMLVDVTFLSAAQSSEVEASSTRTVDWIYVPQRCIHQEVDGAFVWLADQSAGVARKKAIEVRGSAGAIEGNRDMVHVASGLDVASRLIDSGSEGLRDGDRIRVVGEASSFEEGR